MNRIFSACLCLFSSISVFFTACAGTGPSCTAWLPYWESESALEEAAKLSGELDTAVAFAAIFDSKDRPLMLPETEKLLDTLQERYKDSDTRVLLSVVNDAELSEGSYDNKSVKLLKRLLKDDESIRAHIEYLFRLVDDYGLSGLEIDYENMKKDEALWQRFAVFIEELYRQFSAQGLSLRVVLSWDAPKYISLPEGPEYSVMCYNLYGSHSGPGPKADIEFLKETCELYKDYADSTHMAFATGGFDWSDGAAAAMTQQQAEDRLVQCGVRPARDADSGALYAVYEYENTQHTLWYADAVTLSRWRDTVSEYGFEGVDLFRLGGNDTADLKESFFS